MSLSSPSQWFFSTPPKANLRMRLFCFPYAGKGASLFSGWSALLPDEIQVCAVQLPGKESRIREHPPDSLHVLARDIARVMEPLLDVPFALLGHSIGSLLAFEVACEVRRLRHHEPAHFFACAHAAPQQAAALSGVRRLDDAELISEVRSRYGGIPDTILHDRDLLKLLIPALRADLTMLETYHYTEPEPLQCPISTFAGSADAAAPAGSMEPWSEQTTGSFRMRIVPGDHFFIQSARKQVVRSVASDLQAVLEPACSST